jgi:type I restriction enzyme R subunit
MGWQHIEGDWDVAELTERDNFKQVLLTQRLREAIRHINRDENGNIWLDDSQINTAITQLERLGTSKLIEANQTVTDLLLFGTTVEGKDGKNVTIHYIDFEHCDRNDFLVINQFRVDPPWSSGNQGFCIPDIVLFVNGIPLVVIECKSPKLQNPLTEAIGDLLKYSNQRNSSQPEGIEKLFSYNLLMIAASQHRAAAGTVGSSYEDYVEWKDTTPHTQADIAQQLGVSQLNSRQTLIAGMLHPTNLLDILHNFTLFKTSGGRTIKIVPRYQQYRAVCEALHRLQHNQTRSQQGTEDQRGGIIWHTQGSGKSLTMVYLVRKLRTIAALRRFKIALVTDRTDLEKQLSDTATLTGEPLQRARTVSELEKLLALPGAGLVFGTIQKFRGGEDSEEEALASMPKNLNPSEDILVLIDEAHRSHANTLHSNLLEALPNCARIGFTGTPIVKDAKKTTTEIFGSFIDKYTIRQSQEDGVTLPILYEGLEARGIVTQGDDLDRLFELIFQDKTEEERAQIKAKYATKNQVAEARELIKAKAQDMLRHYIGHILPNGFKAQIVAPSRLAAVRYYEALNEAKNILVQQLESRAAVLRSLTPEALTSLDSQTQFLAQALPHLDTIRRLEFAPVISAYKKDEPSWREWTDKGKQETRIERFKNPLNKDGLAILIVKSMLLTGFDAPIEQVLYLDRGMKDYELLQAIARVNRTYAKKDYGLVVDYYGVDLPAALSVYDDADLESAWFDIRDELPKLRERHQRLMQLFAENGCKINDLDACVELLRDERLRVEFSDKLKDFLESLDLVLPRPVAKRDSYALNGKTIQVSYVNDAKQLGLIKKSVADLYRDEKLNLIEAREKVKALIDQYIESQGIDPKVSPIDILSMDFKTHVQRHCSIKSQAAEMEYAARYYIDIHFEEDPVYYHSLSDRLDEILQSFTDNWEEQVKALRQYVEQVQAGRPEEQTGLDPKTQLPFLSLLAEDSHQDLSELARATVEIVNYIRSSVRRVHFWQNLVAQDELRSWLVQYLDDNNLIPFEKQESVADRLVQLARHNHERLVT